MSAVQVKNENYEPKKLDAMYRNLQARVENGSPQDYEVKVDDFVVVARTNDPERFLSYAEFIHPDTRYITVLLYRHNSRSSDKYFFHLRPNAFSGNGSVNGLGSVHPEEYEQRQKEQWKKDQHYEQLVQENEELRQELEKYESTVKRIEAEKEDIRENRDLTFQGILGMGLSSVLNLKGIREKFPFVENLTGVNKTTDERQQTHHQEQEASFKRKGEPPVDAEVEEQQAEDLSEADKAHIEFLKDIKNHVGDIELQNIMYVLDLLVAKPHAIPFALKQISNYLKQKPESTSVPKEKNNPLVNLKNDEIL